MSPSPERPTGECKVAMSGPTCTDPNCPPCQHPEMERVEDRKATVQRRSTKPVTADDPRVQKLLSFKSLTPEDLAVLVVTGTDKLEELRNADTPASPVLGDEERDRLLDEDVLDEAEAAYKSSPIGGRRALEAAMKAAIEEAKNGR